MSELRQRAKQLRKSMTHEEVKRWLQLKYFNARGFYFRRQVPVDGYILDFVEIGQKLIIEVDGAQNGDAAVASRDAQRDSHFESVGFRVVRFWNFQINHEMDGVIDHLQSLLPEPPPALARHLPRGGGG